MGDDIASMSQRITLINGNLNNCVEIKFNYEFVKLLSVNVDDYEIQEIDDEKVVFYLLRVNYIKNEQEKDLSKTDLILRRWTECNSLVLELKE